MPKPSTPTTTTTKDKDKPRKSSGSISTPKKSPLKSSNSQEGWWEADEILDQKGKRYLVSWVGTNPETGRAYSPTWEPEENCNRELLDWWRRKKRVEKKPQRSSSGGKAVAGQLRVAPTSITNTPVSSEQSTPTATRPKRRSTITPKQEPKDRNSSGEYLPSQAVAVDETRESPSLRPRKRKASGSVHVLIRSTSRSSAHSHRESPKERTPALAKEASESPIVSEAPVPKRRRVARASVQDSQPEFAFQQAEPQEILDITSSSPPVQPSSPIAPVEEDEVPIEVRAEEIVVEENIQEEIVQEEIVEEVIVEEEIVEEVQESAPKEPSPIFESPRRSRTRSRQPSPADLERHRSLSPVTKVDTWLSVNRDYQQSAEEEIVDTSEEIIKQTQEEPPQQEQSLEQETSLPHAVPETLHSGTISQIQDPPSVEMNPTNNLRGMVPTPSQFTPIQVVQQRNSQGPSPSPTLSSSMRQGQPQPTRRSSSHSQRAPSQGTLTPNFSSQLGLRTRLENAKNNAAYEEIRSMASYGKKTRSLASSVSQGSSLLSQATSASSLSTEHLRNMKLVHLGELEMILGVPATELQVRMTRGVLINKQKEIQEFCLNPNEASEQIVEMMKDVVETCSAIATHPYLIITPPLANAELPEPREAEYVVASSGKFSVLAKILDALKGDKEIKIAVVVESAKGLELLEGFLRGKDIRVRRSEGGSVRSQQLVEGRGGPSVLLVLGGKAGFRAMVSRVDLVIAMDLSFNAEDHQILRLRQHPINLDELSPVIRLITVNTAEHVRLCLPSAHEIPSNRLLLQALIAATALLRNFTGAEIPTDDARYSQVAEWIRSRKETDVFGIRDIETYMAGHKGLAGLALKRARSPTDEAGPDPKRQKTTKAIWQQPSMDFLQRENDELHERLAQKQLQNETLRTDLRTLQLKFDTLSLERAGIETRIQETLNENQFLRSKMASAPETDPLHMQSEILRLTKALESKTKDFEFVAARYQEAGAAASENAQEAKRLKAEVESLTRRLEVDVKKITWEGERRGLLEKIRELEAKCKLLEETVERTRLRHGTDTGAT